MNKDAIIIMDVFLNSSHKLEVFKKTFQSVKKLNLPVLIISNYKVPEDLIKEFDYFIYSKDNLLFSNSYDRYPVVMFFFDNDAIRYENHTKCYQKHGLSVISNLNKCSQFAKNLGYKKFIRIEWDFIIDDDDVSKINEMIQDFIKYDKKAYFIYDPRNASGLPNLAYHFWMVDLDFWNNNFPNIHDEIDYKKYIYEKNNENFFEIAERILYMSLFDKLSQNEIILEGDFYNIFQKSKINNIINDINFDPPSGNGVCRGFAKVIRNGNLTGELALFSWNRCCNEVDTKNYDIYFDQSQMNFSHSVGLHHWSYSLVANFSKDKFPIILKMNDDFIKQYNNFDEINCLLDIKS